ncbi:casein kinase I [Friedmanniomyces endolithicus]|nr:casein kinase I [Friedmanniomyces endolithicus]
MPLSIANVKPANFLLGSGTNGNVIYVTDFGLADDCTVSRAQAAEDNPSRSHLVGTARFASIKGHRGQMQSPRDDLESLGYMLVFFCQGKLPWQSLPVHNKEERNRAFLEEKMATTAEQLCEELPGEFAQYM